MSWLSTLFKGGGNPIKDAGEALDNLFTSDDERNQARIVLAELEGKLETAVNEQITSRWKADMASDSVLSKNVRPLMWIGLGVFYALLSIVHIALTNWGVEIEEVITYSRPGVPAIVLSGTLNVFLTLTAAYVGFREIGKGIINWKKK